MAASSEFENYGHIIFLVGVATQADIDSLMSESATMVNFDHPNVVKLIGVCFDTTDQLPFIILPFMVNKDLKSFLVAKREQSQNLKEDQFPKVCVDYSPEEAGQGGVIAVYSR